MPVLSKQTSLPSIMDCLLLTCAYSLLIFVWPYAKCPPPRLDKSWAHGICASSGMSIGTAVAMSIHLFSFRCVYRKHMRCPQASVVWCGVGWCACPQESVAVLMLDDQFHRISAVAAGGFRNSAETPVTHCDGDDGGLVILQNQWRMMESIAARWITK